ncbi:MAG: vitamin B12-dependent ribonucleotide reductase [Candidatus Omnitrophota bacterium]
MALNLSENSKIVLEKRYLKKDFTGKIVETPEEMFKRVAKAIASADKKYGRKPQEILKLEENFYQMMTTLEFMPNSPTLMNAGRELGQLSACFVLPIDDSMESIFETLKATALIHKSGGGTGFAFSRLRPKSSVVRSTGGVASGPVSFMKVFDAATQAVKQGGTRRGANMGILKVDHPDILEFITCKENDKEINNFNISVAITNDFMKKLENQEDYDLIDPHTKKAVKRLNTKNVFDLIIKMAHKNGEPGIIFIDKMNEFNPTPKLGLYESTNPCGEQVLLPYESCNLGSINLSRMLFKENGSYTIDWQKLKNTVHKAVHFLDNVIDMNKFPLAEIGEQTKLTRKIGLGVMGWGSLLLRSGIPYDCDEAVKLADKVMSFILKEARKESQELAGEKGTFPAFKKSKYYNRKNKLELRNATLTTIAPTGTISLIAGPCSSGIEPIFAISFYRSQCLDNERMVETDPVFVEVAKERGFYTEELMSKIAEKGSIKDFQEIPEDVRRVFVTAHDIAPEWHIKMQAAFQQYTDNAVSKTVNFPNSAVEDDVRNVYMSAHELGCKGVTIYRDGSREEQVLNIAKATLELEPGTIGPRPRPEVVTGTTTKVSTGCGNLYVTINFDEEEKPFEVFTQMGKAGGCAASQLEAVGRLLSLALRSGIDIKSVIDQLHGIRCPSPSWEKGVRIFSCADAISRVVERRLGNVTASEQIGIDTIDVKKNTNVASEAAESQGTTQTGTITKTRHTNIVGVCPDCGGALRHEEGCLKCHACGFSKC